MLRKFCSFISIQFYGHTRAGIIQIVLKSSLFALKGPTCAHSGQEVIAFNCANYLYSSLVSANIPLSLIIVKHK